MKRFLPLALLLLLVLPGCAGMGAVDVPERASVLPDTLAGEMAGAPMTLLADSVDAKAGFACWAWEETEGTPKLLVVEFRFPPQDCDGLYEDAMQGAEPLSAPEGASACYDGRAAHLRTGLFYVRIAALGFTNEKDALTRLAAELSGALLPLG